MHTNLQLHTYRGSKEDIEAAQITITQISVLITSLDASNYANVEREIQYILQRSPPIVYLKYWKKLLPLVSVHIKEHNKLDTSSDLLHRLVYDLFQDLKFKSNEIVETLRTEIFFNAEFLSQIKLNSSELLAVLDPEEDKPVSYTHLDVYKRQVQYVITC